MVPDHAVQLAMAFAAVAVLLLTRMWLSRQGKRDRRTRNASWRKRMDELLKTPLHHGGSAP